MKLSSAAARFVSSGFGSGLIISKGAGTVGSVAAAGFWYFSTFLGSLALPAQIISLALIIGLGAICVESVLASGDRQHSDPSWVVIDEWAGMGMALTLVQPTTIWDWVLSFAFFRLFDIWKPSLVGRAEKLPGAIGVMSDDIIAGALAAGLYYFSIWLIWIL